MPIPNSEPDVLGELVILRPVVLDHRLGIRPAAVEQRQQPMVEDSAKRAEGGVLRVAQPVPDVFGQVDGQRTVGTEQAQELHLDPWRSASEAGVKAEMALGAKASDGSWPNRTGSSAARGEWANRGWSRYTASRRRRSWKKSNW